VTMAAGSLRDLRIAEIAELDMQLEEGSIIAYRAKVKLSFKYHGGPE
jgi:dodecin